MSTQPPAASDYAELEARLSHLLGLPGPLDLTRLKGGNSNQTFLLRTSTRDLIVRRPPPASLSPTAHRMDREHRVMSALAQTHVPVPAPVAFDAGADGPGPVLIMEAVDGVPLTDALPGDYPADALADVGHAVIDALADLHGVDWRGVGLSDFGYPDGFLARQVSRWQRQFESYQVRELPDFERVAQWLDGNLPPEQPAALFHGDFHLDNCLMTPRPPIAVAGMIDWEMASIGDPLVDLGLLLAFWGDERPAEPAIPWVQAVTRGSGAPTRHELAERYALRSGRSIEALAWYMAFAFWKLAAIVEGAYAQHARGLLDSSYASDLETDVPALLRESAAIAGPA